MIFNSYVSLPEGKPKYDRSPWIKAALQTGAPSRASKIRKKLQTLQSRRGSLNTSSQLRSLLPNLWPGKSNSWNGSRSTNCSTWSPLSWTRFCALKSCYVHRLIWRPVGHFPQNQFCKISTVSRHRRKIWILQSFRVILRINWIQREWRQILWSMIYKVLQTCRTDSKCFRAMSMSIWVKFVSQERFDLEE